MKGALGLLLVQCVAAIAGGIALVYSGLPEVAATTPHWALTEWVLETAMENSVERRSRDIAPPPFLDDETRIRAGASAYDAMCADCHGAPGRKAGPVGEGLLPAPPDLAESASAWRPSELFWIVKHGVRMTGMPAFEPTHTDEQLWELVALVKRLPELSPVRYRQLTAVRETERGHGH